MFSRVKTKRQKAAPRTAPIPEEDVEPKPRDTSAKAKATAATTSNSLAAASGLALRSAEPEPEDATKKRDKRKMSFSTPVAAEKQPVRKSKRLSQEDNQSSPQATTQQNQDALGEARSAPVRGKSPTKAVQGSPTIQTQAVEATQDESEIDGQHSGTKIALPFADTPVIRRNKEMRENKSKKGERRSSLSMRGRRASSLIESGNSNGKHYDLPQKQLLTDFAALPHNEVEVADFYKHIEAEGLPEPRRMRQLLTWCATRSLDQKPMGASFEISSAIAAARVIQDELLKDLGNKSELSDWFSREEVALPAKELPERPNPKNTQNSEKIAELEEQIARYVKRRHSQLWLLTIRRLKLERDALEKLLKPPPEQSYPRPSKIDTSLLSPDEAEILQQLQGGTGDELRARVDQIFDKLEPAVDAFADGVHKVAQYRDAADSVANRVLSIAADKLADRENDGRKRAQPERDRSPKRDLGSVLRGLSRADR